MPGPADIPQVDPDQAQRLADDGALLLDVREDDEWAAGHIRTAVHTPLGALLPGQIPSGRPVVAVCRSGNRSGRAAQQLAAAGVEVYNLAGGMQAWAATGHPVTRDDDSPGTVA